MNRNRQGKIAPASIAKVDTSPPGPALSVVACASLGIKFGGGPDGGVLLDAVGGPPCCPPDGPPGGNPGCPPDGNPGGNPGCPPDGNPGGNPGCPPGGNPGGNPGGTLVGNPGGPCGGLCLLSGVLSNDILRVSF